MITDQQLLAAAMREDFSTFVDRTFREISGGTEFVVSTYMELIARKLQQCFERKITRLIINMPPRYGKSTCASVALPAWILGRDPTERIICVSYSEELSERFARDTRRVMQSPWYRKAFPATVLGGKSAMHDFWTTRQGYRFATSVRGALMGMGGNIFIIDDANHNDDATSSARRENVIDWFRGTLITRQNDRRNSVIIVVQQRLHVDDLSGYLMQNEPDDWEVLSLPAIATCDERFLIGPDRYHIRKEGDLLDPAREDMASLERQRRSMQANRFSSMYQQDPVPDDGDLLKWPWFQTYNRPALLYEPGDRYVQSWDTAMKAGELNDYSVCTTWLVKGRDYYLMDVWRKRALFPDLKRAVYQQAERWSPEVILIEDKGSGTSLIQQLLDEDHPDLPRPIARTPTTDKVTRMASQSVRIEQGHVHVPNDASWLAAFRAEMLQFPNAKNDDQVDSVSMFLEWVTEKTTGDLIISTYRS